MVQFAIVGSVGDVESPENAFGRRVRLERILRGWTQADLAKALEHEGLSLHPSAIAKIELRDSQRPRVIRLDEAKAIAAVFGLSLDEMFESGGERVQVLTSRIRDWLERAHGLATEGNYLAHDVEVLMENREEENVEPFRRAIEGAQFVTLVDDFWNRLQRAHIRFSHPSYVMLGHAAAAVDEPET